VTTNNQPKPICKLTGENGNVYNLIGQAEQCLVHAGQRDKATEMSTRCLHADSYDHVLAIIMEYLDVE